MPDRSVALFRGINVGKAKRVAMAGLRKLFLTLGYSEVQTLLNSGNVVFTPSDDSSAKAAGRIEKALTETHGISARVTVLTAKELRTIVAEISLQNLADNPSRLLVSVVRDKAELKKLNALKRKKWGDEAFAVGSRVAYLWCPHNILESPLADAVGRALGDSVTARNWATILKLLALVDGNSR